MVGRADGFAMKRWGRVTVITTMVLLVASACTATPVIQPLTASQAATNQQPAGFDQAEYCATLVTLFAVEPEGTADDALEGFAVLLEAAVDGALPEHQQVLRDAAAANRNPALLFEEGAAEEAIQAMEPVLDYARDVCGIDVDEEPTSIDGGSMEFSSSAAGIGDGLVPEDPGIESPRPQPATSDFASRAAAVNAAVPADSNLVFDWIASHEEGDPDLYFDVLVPVGSEIEVSSFGVEARANSGDMEFGTKCQGFCTPQPWVEVMDNPESSPFAMFEDSDRSVLLVQELESPAGRLVVTRRDGPFGEIEITVARWSDAATHFFSCEVELDLDDEALWPAFADACIAADPSWF